jgi:diadenosine tetraphosphate (Ap4A) HIT family hydrolase
MLNLKDVENQLSMIAPAGRTLGCMFCDVSKPLIESETENLWLIRDKYPIADGHYMIISKDHYGCMGELPIPFFDEIEQLRWRLPYSQSIAYEHGRAGHCVKLKGSQVTCHHFHLHFLPLDADIRTLLQPRFSSHKMSALSEVRRLFETLGEYLFFENYDGQKLFYPASSQVESHLLRTLICKTIGSPERADWESL